MTIESKGTCDVCKAPISIGSGFAIVKYQSPTGLAVRIVKGIGGGDQEEHLCGKECLIKKLSGEIDGITENVVDLMRPAHEQAAAYEAAAGQNGGNQHAIIS